MKNLEIKSKCRNHRFAVAAARKLRAKYKGVLRQTDAYFNLPAGTAKSGRLKMRIINGSIYELIHYRRANVKRARYSNYELIRLRNGRQLFRVLKSSFGISCVVTKQRKLFIYENARIHLDTVKGLGKFIEFEIVCMTRKDEREAPAKMKFLKEIFHIDDREILPYSYCDMI